MITKEKHVFVDALREIMGKVKGRYYVDEKLEWWEFQGGSWHHLYWMPDEISDCAAWLIGEFQSSDCHDEQMLDCGHSMEPVFGAVSALVDAFAKIFNDSGQYPFETPIDCPLIIQSFDNATELGDQLAHMAEPFFRLCENCHGFRRIGNDWKPIETGTTFQGFVIYFCLNLLHSLMPDSFLKFDFADNLLTAFHVAKLSDHLKAEPHDCKGGVINA